MILNPESYQQVLDYLYTLITNRRALKFSGENGIKRTKYLLELLGNPQEKIQIIHIAGTSGKGSTACIMSSLLSNLGFKTGLQISPHLLDLRERFQINNKLVSKEKIIQIFNEVKPFIEKAKNTPWGKITFFEAIVAFSFYLFFREKVQYAVIETGLGGLYDGSNVVENHDKISVITQIGLDHQWILGRNLTKITAQKAGIIKKKNTVITIKQKQAVNKVLLHISTNLTAELFIIEKNINFKINKTTENGSYFDFNFGTFKLDNLHLNLIGHHQIQNTSLALVGLYILSQKHKFRINENNIRQTLSNINFPGRFEIFRLKNKKVIVDGAHNPQKMRAFLKALDTLHPDKKFDFLISFSRSKDQITTLRGMLKIIIKKANKIFISDFILEGQDSSHQSVDINKIASILRGLNFDRYQIVKRSRNMLNRLLKLTKCPLIITGSLYFLSSLYKDLKKLD